MAVILSRWENKSEVLGAAMDSDGNLNPVGLVDGVDVAALKIIVDGLVATGGGGTDLFNGDATSGNISLSQPITDFSRIEFVAEKTSGSGEIYSMTVKTDKIPVDSAKTVEVIGSGTSTNSHVRMSVQADLTTVGISQAGGVSLISVIGWS